MSLNNLLGVGLESGLGLRLGLGLGFYSVVLPQLFHMSRVRVGLKVGFGFGVGFGFSVWFGVKG